MVEFVSTFMFVPNCMLLKILDLWIVFHYLILNDCLFWDLRLKKIINEILVEIMCGWIEILVCKQIVNLIQFVTLKLSSSQILCYPAV